MIGYVCDVSQYPQFYVKDFDMYQVLPRPYLGSFDGGPGDKLVKKWMLDLESQSETFFWECIESRITIDDIEKGEKSQYWTTLKNKLRRQNKYYHQYSKLGKLFLPLWLSLVVESSVITTKI